MKILIVCGAGYVSGLEVINLNLIEGFRQRGHDVRVLTSTWGDGDFVKRLEDLCIPYKRLPLGFISKTLSWSAIRMTLDQLLKMPELWLGYWHFVGDFDPDIILQSNFHHLFVLLPIINAKKTFFHIHSYFLPTSFYRFIFKAINLKVTYFIGVSKFIGKSLIEIGIPNSKVLSILNGISIKRTPDNFVSLPLSNFFNEQDNDNSQIVKISIVGQIGQWKGHDDLIEALYHIKSWGLPFVCIIFGRGEDSYIQALKQKLDNYSLTQQIHWAGFVKNPSHIFSQIDICVVPSLNHDPCPTVAIEAAYFGIPVIATRRGGLPEIVQDGETGYLVDAESPMQIAEKLKLLIEDTDLRDKMGQTAHSYALQHFSQERMVQEMESIFLKVNN